MNLKPIQIHLPVEAVSEVLRIALDDDREQALVFVKQVLAKKAEKALQRH